MIKNYTKYNISFTVFSSSSSLFVFELLSAEPVHLRSSC